MMFDSLSLYDLRPLTEQRVACLRSGIWGGPFLVQKELRCQGALVGRSAKPLRGIFAQDHFSFPDPSKDWMQPLRQASVAGWIKRFIFHFRHEDSPPGWKWKGSTWTVPRYTGNSKFTTVAVMKTGPIKTNASTWRCRHVLQKVGWLPEREILSDSKMDHSRWYPEKRAK